VGLEEALTLAERVRRAVESTPLSGDELQPVGPVTISVGLAALRRHAEAFSRLIELADNAMYEAKQAGRNRVVLWGEQQAPATLGSNITPDPKQRPARRGRKAAA
jgi:diguanylate cyclase (GGDEF)-like protein